MPIPKTDLSYSNFTFKLHGGEDNLKQTITFGCLQKKKKKKVEVRESNNTHQNKIGLFI